MTAKVTTRIGSDRTPLQDVIPLETPFLVFVDPSDICNASCEWCPSGNDELIKSVKTRKPQIMELDLYRKIINDLCDMPQPIKTLRLYKDGEPLMNPNFEEMVNIAKGTGRFGIVDTTSNGWFLDKLRNVRIHQSGLDRIFLSVPQNYTQRYVENVRDLYDGKSHLHIHCKFMITNNNYQATLFWEDFQEICDTISVEHVSPCWPGIEVPNPSPALNFVGIYGQPLPQDPVTVCPYIFYSAAINSDGTVSRCFLDWRHNMLLGDLRTHSFKSVWNGHTFKAIRQLHLDKLRFVLPGCRDCQQLLYGSPDNIDKYSEELRERIL